MVKRKALERSLVRVRVRVRVRVKVRVRVRVRVRVLDVRARRAHRAQRRSMLAVRC